MQNIKPDDAAWKERIAQAMLKKSGRAPTNEYLDGTGELQWGSKKLMALRYASLRGLLLPYDRSLLPHNRSLFTLTHTAASTRVSRTCAKNACPSTFLHMIDRVAV